MRGDKSSSTHRRIVMDCVVFVAVMCYVQDRLIHCLPVETTAPQFPYTTLSIIGDNDKRP